MFRETPNSIVYNSRTHDIKHIVNTTDICRPLSYALLSLSGAEEENSFAQEPSQGYLGSLVPFGTVQGIHSYNNCGYTCLTSFAARVSHTSSCRGRVLMVKAGLSVARMLSGNRHLSARPSRMTVPADFEPRIWLGLGVYTSVWG